MIYLLDRDKTIIKILPQSEIVELWENEAVSEMETIEGYLKLSKTNMDWLEKSTYLAVQHRTDKYSFKMYKFVTYKSDNTSLYFYGIQYALDNLKARGYVEDYRPHLKSVQEVMQTILTGTGIELGFVESNIKPQSTSFYYLQKNEAVSKVIEVFQVELDFKIAITKNKITKEYVDVYYQMGSNTGKRFAYGTNALEVVKEFDESQLYTAILPRGKGEEVGETASGDATYGRRINISDVVWSKSNGNPLDKPKGAKVLELPSATKTYGYSDGTPRTLLKTYENIDDVNQLIEQAYQDLLVYSRPRVQFKATVGSIGDFEKGDTVAIVRHDLGIKYQTRIFKIKRNRLNNKLSEVSLGDVLVESTAKKEANYKTTLNEIVDNLTYELNNVYLLAQDGTSVYFGADEPPKKKVGDIWYKRLANGKVEMYIWDGESWKLEANDVYGKEITEQVDKALQESQKAKDQAKQAQDKADSIGTQVETVKNDIQKVALTVDDIKAQTNTIKNTADSAKETAQNALDKYTSMGMYKAYAETSDGSKGFTRTLPSTNYLKNTQFLGDNDFPIIWGVGSGTRQLLSTGIKLVSNSATNQVGIGSSLTNTLPTGKYNLTFGIRGVGFVQVYLFLNNGKNIELLKQNISYADNFERITIPITLTEANKDVKSIAFLTMGTSNWFELKDKTTKFYNDGGDTTWVSAEAPSLYGLKYVGFSVKDSSNYLDYKWILRSDVVGESVQIDITNINNELGQKVSLVTFDVLEKTVNTQQTQITQNKNDIALKASVTDVDLIKDTVKNQESQIKLNSEQIKLKSDITEVDNLKKTVTSQGTEINLAKNQLTLKANKTDVDNLTGRMASAESSITTQAGKITLVSQNMTEQDNKIALLQQTSTELKSTITTLQYDLSNMTIGGRNYFSVENWKNNGFTPSSGIRTVDVKLAPNTEYIVSTNIPPKSLTAYDCFIGVKPLTPSSATNGFGKGKPMKIKTSATGIISVACRNYSLTTGDWWIMLELGNIVTDWTQALEDVPTLSQYSEILQKINIVQVTVADKADKSQITVLQDNINLKVSKDNILNQINISSEGILIDGTKLHITATTTIDDAVIKSAMIDTISASKINTGELDAYKVNVVNLNAANLVSGYINADRIAARSITADKLTANAVQVGFNAIGNVVKVYPASLQIISNGNPTMKLTADGLEFWRLNSLFSRMLIRQSSITSGRYGLEQRIYNAYGYYTWTVEGSNGDGMTYDPTGGSTGRQGLSVEENLFVGPDYTLMLAHMKTYSGGTGSGIPSVEVSVYTKKIGTVDYFFIGTPSGKCGIAIDPYSDKMYIVSGNRYMLADKIMLQS